MSVGFGFALPHWQAAAGASASWEISAAAENIRAAIADPARSTFAPHNTIRNSVGSGAVVGTPGTAPTNWTLSGAAGLSWEVVATGTEDGLSYVDVRLSGTASAASPSSAILFEANNIVLASAAQTWTLSTFIRIVSGDFTGISLRRLAWDERSTVFLTTRNSSNLTIQNGGTLGTAKISFTTVNQNAATTNVRPYFAITPINGGVVDITLRVAQPELYQGPLRAGIVLTSGTAVGVDYGYRLPGTAGAVLSSNARTSLAMEQAADGTWGFARHNMVRNSTMVGVVAGTPGTLPTNWTVNLGTTGLSSEVVGTGAEDGMAYTDFRLFGTASATTGMSLRFDAAAFAEAVVGQSWTASMFIRQVAGTRTGITSSNLAIYENNAVGSFLTSGSTGFTATGATFTRVSFTRTLVNASVARTQSGISINVTSGAAVDITFRIAQPELYQGAVRTGIIPTTTAARYAPAIDWLSGIGRWGLRSEAAATNSIRNNTMQGAVVGTPGTAPTNWTSVWNGTQNGLSLSIVGLGNESGFPYVDVRIAGTSTATSGIIAGFEPVTQIVATSGQVWSMSLFCTLVAGSVGNLNLRVYVDERDAAGVFVSGGSSSTTFTPVSGTLGASRYAVTRTLAGATCERIFPALRIAADGSSTYDVTIRIACPQLELNSRASSPILTYGATATRAADAVIVRDSGWLSVAAGTLSVEYRPTLANSTTVAGLTDGTANEQVALLNDGVLSVVDGGSSQAAPDAGTPTLDALNRVAGAYAVDDFTVALNGGAPATDTSGTLPTTDEAVVGAFDGHITRIRYTKRRLPNGVLQGLTL